MTRLVTMSSPAHDCVLKLKQLLGSKVKTSEKEIAMRSHDVSYHSPHPPHAVVYVESEADIVSIVKTCNAFHIPVIAVGGASSLEGHIIPTKERGAVILDTSNMDRIVAIHEKDLDVVVEPGVGWITLRDELEPLGLFYPPDPGSAACIGGMCGTNCSGTLAWRYGTMKDHVLSLRVVLADGTVIQTRQRATKSSAGYDLTRLFVGSEGTLGIISQITLRLRRIPTHSTMILSQYETLEDAAKAVENVVHSGLILNRMELMDVNCIRSVNLSHPEHQFPEKTTLLFECAGPSASSVTEMVESVSRIAHSCKCTMFQFAKSADEADTLWNIRKRAYFATKALRPQQKNQQILTTDVAVPISQLHSVLVKTRQDLDDMGLVSSIVAHAGDGNYHCMLLIDPTNPVELEKAEAFRVKNARMALALGGTCTGEHGVGVGKIQLLEEEVGLDTVDVMRRLKKTLDPNGIFNPGKVFTPTRQESLSLKRKSKL